MQAFIQGLTIGLAYVAPIGMQNMFVINSALTQKRSRAFLCSCIVVFFDITLALACFFGIGIIMEQSKYIEMGVLALGGLIVIYIGISLLRAKEPSELSQNVDIPLSKVITTACVVTWFNPQALIDGTMMLGAFRASFPPDQATMFITGVMTASFLWFNGITAVLSLLHYKFNVRVIRVINIICGIVIIAYGLKLLYNFYNVILAFLSNL